MPKANAPKSVMIISDGTGQTAENVLRACHLQFEGVALGRETFPNVTDRVQLSRLMNMAAERGALVMVTLVDATHRAFAEQLAEQLQLPFIDLMGGPLYALSDYLSQGPKGAPGLMYRADARYFRRMEAVEFTVKADDGKEPRMFPEADIVLLGVSRTGKTPLSVYLAHKGYKVGNFPLVLGQQLPEQVWEVDPSRIFGLTISPEILHVIRQGRLETMRANGRGHYADMDYILAEIDSARELFERNPDWKVLDVSSRAVEETAALIVQILRGRGLDEDARRRW